MEAATTINERVHRMGLPLLSIEQIKAAVDLSVVEMEIPEWGGSIKVGALSVEERDELILSCTDNGRADGTLDSQKFMRKLAVLGSREPKLTDEIIARKNFGVIDKIAKKVLELSGMSKGASVVADVTFRQEPGPAVPVQPGEGTA